MYKADTIHIQLTCIKIYWGTIKKKFLKGFGGGIDEKKL